tara:strand:+ start:3826 stop:4158 length:333 start_codon:yes stop_codon:yes gene_type:complete
LSKNKKSLVKEYLENVVSKRPLTEAIEKISFKIQIFEEDGKTNLIEAVKKEKLDYIILVTKLTTMIEMFNLIKNDDNIVMIDKMQLDIENFMETISSTIDKSKKEFANEK